VISSIHPGPRKKAVPPKNPEACLSKAEWAKRRLEVWLRDGGKCVLCGKHLHITEAETDHIRKRSLGRNDAADNLRTLCKPCHRKRHNQ
jgi:5-methylcytosine-specific restriction endonuclease McrA